MLLGNIRDDESETFETRQLRHSYRLEVGMLFCLNSLDHIGSTWIDLFVFFAAHVAIVESNEISYTGV